MLRTKVMTRSSIFFHHNITKETHMPSDKNKLSVIFIFLILIAIILAINKKLKSQIYEDSGVYPDDQTITINLSDQPQIPWKQVDTSTYVVESFSAAVHGNLVSFNGTFNESTDSNSLLEKFFCDGKICYANLKKGIYFHNEREVTAYDIEFSFIRQLLTFSNDNFAKTILDDLVGIDNLKKENIKKIIVDEYLNYPSGLISGIKVKDKYNIIFNLKNENSHFFQKVSTGYLPIVPVEEFDETYLNWKHYPIGFGKYKVVKIDLHNYVFVVERVSDKEDIPKFIRFIFDQRDIGDIKGYIGLNKQNPNFDGHIIFPDIYSSAGFLFNFKTELGANKNFRKAISLALDRQRISKSSPYGEFVADDQLLPASGWQKNYRAEIPVQKRNIEKAKSLLSTIPENLWKDKVFNVHTFWPTSRDLNQEPYIHEIKEQLKEIGIQINFINTDMNYTKFKKDDKNVLWWSGFDTSKTDPNSNFAFFKKGSFFDNIYPDDPYLDKLFDDATKNLSKSPIFTRQLSQYFTENQIMVVVFQVRISFLYRKKRISSFGNQYNPIKVLVWELKLNK
ncbi:ABC transporter substrate-binding protein [Pigmentibacter ruber]|uniref:ABC transporter substrate-binding protein n=1 Tax=Pigmentibacter ruber TaxID=2683196 RepID=UPI00131D69C7|nr:ABC transporter substrate-binding protein [Pigmentibacter ruber]